MRAIFRTDIEEDPAAAQSLEIWLINDASRASCKSLDSPKLVHIWYTTKIMQGLVYVRTHAFEPLKGAYE